MGLFIFIVYLLGWHIGLYGMFKKAGIAPWKALIPFYNTWLIVEKTGIKKIWFFFQLIPIVGQFITLWITILWVMHFGKFTLWQHTLTLLVPFIYLPYLGFSSGETYKGQAVVDKYKKSKTREWIDAAAFAVVAATIIRTFIFEAYTIPTGSMEKTLLVNDFLFVSKFTYGPRVPNTPLSFPFVHNYLPVTNGKSYLEWIKLPYKRWFAKPVKRNDVVVFNFPAGDTVIHLKEYESAIPYYDVKTRAEAGSSADQEILNDPDNYPLAVHPVDKQENYIKRCVAIAGDTIQIIHGDLYVNGKPAYISPTAATDYIVTIKGVPMDVEGFATRLREEGIRINHDEMSPDLSFISGNLYDINLTLDEVEKLKKLPFIEKVARYIDSSSNILIFPRDKSVANWSADEFGPLWIPRKGATIQLTKENIAFYKRAIQTYENNKWEEREGHIFLNGQPATSYTFKMNYYWMMGDNRHRSQDSRYWGFVPEDHIVGSAALIWMSWENGLRWKRLFNRIR